MRWKDWWLPQWTLPLSAAARHKERTGIDFVPNGQEPLQFQKLMGSDPEDSSEDEGWDVERGCVFHELCQRSWELSLWFPSQASTLFFDGQSSHVQLDQLLEAKSRRKIP